MKRMNIVTIYDPLGDIGGSVFVFNVPDSMTANEVVNKCTEAVYEDLCKDYMDADGVFELPDYDRSVGDVLGEVADNINVQRALGMKSIEFIECLGGSTEFVNNDDILITTDGCIYSI